MDAGGNKKPVYDVWKYVDTNLTFKVADQYLPYLNMYYTDPNRYKTYYELIEILRKSNAKEKLSEFEKRAPKTRPQYLR